MVRILLLCLLIQFDALHLVADDTPFPLSAQRIVFIGDSITYAGHYVDVVDATLQANGYTPEVVNLGLPSETCSGLSEPGHPFPRPNVHTRIDRALSILRPDILVACYGMNDGIYHPLDPQRFAAYQRGVDLIIEKTNASGAKLVLMTPPPFDALPLRGKDKLVPVEAKQFGFRDIYENYDNVLTTYADWIMKQRDRVAMVIDLHSPVQSYVEANRAVDANFTVSPDGIHPNREGHQIIADAILDAWGLETRETADDELLVSVAKRQSIMKAAWLTEVGHNRPGIDPGLPIEEARKVVDAMK